MRTTFFTINFEDAVFMISTTIQEIIKSTATGIQEALLKINKILSADIKLIEKYLNEALGDPSLFIELKAIQE